LHLLLTATATGLVVLLWRLRAAHWQFCLKTLLFVTTLVAVFVATCVALLNLMAGVGR